jgi:hypothetical protein
MLNQSQVPVLLLIKDLGMLYPTAASKRKSRFGLYKCHCGAEFKANTYDVKNGNTKSCGCYHKLTPIKHGLRKHPLYNTWYNMVKRTTSKKYIRFEEYGGRGISVCKRWLDLSNFIEDMYSSYKCGLTLDRIDNDGNYEPSNCRWATKAVQARNTRQLKSTNTSGYRGVSWTPQKKKWIAKIYVNGKKKHLGTFNTPLDAAIAYDAYVISTGLEHTINGAIAPNKHTQSSS